MRILNPNFRARGIVAPDGRRCILQLSNPGSVDLYAKQYVRLLTMIVAVVKTCDASNLIRCEIEVPAANQKQRIRKQNTRIVDYGLDFSSDEASMDCVMLIVAQVHPAFRIRFQSIAAATLFTQVLYGRRNLGI